MFDSELKIATKGQRFNSSQSLLILKLQVVFKLLNLNEIYNKLLE